MRNPKALSILLLLYKAEALILFLPSKNIRRLIKNPSLVDAVSVLIYNEIICLCCFVLFGRFLKESDDKKLSPQSYLHYYNGCNMVID
ncbi:hypothetical protein AALP_AA1G300300 [Arabis alpina]|uniref:Uncharacterized protein n=1 Tax=Arabis alpina TaxID=50452 RepID=A0A087HRL4_ARAAL|nr:hypothetical protein AALP_AA1G300300 [Arabis alpina]